MERGEARLRGLGISGRAGAAGSKHPRERQLRQHNCIVSPSRGWKCTTKVLAGLDPPEAMKRVYSRLLPRRWGLTDSLWCFLACMCIAPISVLILAWHFFPVCMSKFPHFIRTPQPNQIRAPPIWPCLTFVTSLQAQSSDVVTLGVRVSVGF